MIRNRIVRDFSGFFEAYWFVDTDYHKKEAYIDLRERMSKSAIHDNGIFKAFRFSRDNNDVILSYIKIEDADIKSYPDMFGKRSTSRSIYICNRTDQSIKEFQDILNSFLMYNEFDEIDDKVKHEFEDIKEECVKKHNAVYSSVDIDVTNINIDKDHDIISIPYTYYYIKDDFINKIDSEDVIFGEAPLPYGGWFIDYSGPWPADESRKENVENIALSKDVEKVLKDKGVYDWCLAAICPERNTENTLNEEKENKNMKMQVHLLIVPEGMNEEFVNNTKKNLQSNDETTLYVSSNDIAIEPNDRFKTKYKLFERWVKLGYIHCAEFMVGYESDPEAKVFEAFIRGIKANSTSDTVAVLYQKDTIESTIKYLRINYDESSKARDRLDNITDSIMDKVKFFKEEYGLEDDDFDKIRNAYSNKDAYNAIVDKITEVAFDSDKKGNKKK